MKIVFRLNYHTRFGQSMAVKLALQAADSSVRLEQTLALRWLNERQWEGEIEIKGGPARIEYAYLLRQEDNGVTLEEWKGPRVLEIDPAALDAVLLADTWCSAGTIDYAFETSALRSVRGNNGGYATLPHDASSNHLFQLRMAAVPEGLVPCLLGSVREIGDWDPDKAVAMHEVAENLWHTRVRLPEDWWIEYKYGLLDPATGQVQALEEGENRVLAERSLSSRQLTRVSDEAYRRPPGHLERAAGVAIPVFSLRGSKSLGMGEFADLKPLADWASGVGLRLIQILPINDTTSAHDWTDSYPYSAISVFALHPLYLRIDDLDYSMPADFHADLKAARDRLNLLDQVDYEAVMTAKRGLTRRIYEKHGPAILSGADFRKFYEENRSWALPYAAFCVKRDEFGTADFTKWEAWARYDAAAVESMTRSDHPQRAELGYHLWLQYELDRQLADAVAHLHARGLALKGDLPIGIDRQSVDAWSLPHLFKMDAQAGAPPDAFAIKGQNWGFPTYDWEVMSRDGYAWWRARFAQLSRYFDAYRIDHILGFFRIWQVPYDQVEGIMGWFDPALPVSIDEIRGRGIPFDHHRFCRPYLREHFLWGRFGDHTEQAKRDYLREMGGGVWELRPEYETQRKVVEHFATWRIDDDATRERMERLRQGLLDCVSEVLFLEVPGSEGRLFHPRCSMHMTRSFQELDPDLRWRVDELYVDYFYRRQESFWQARGLEKLPVMRQASPMLLCGEDLGMVPDCVPGVLKELGILSLEIQRMPKSSKVEFADPAWAPYLSVVSPSTHDMPTLRGWWREDEQVRNRFAWQSLGVAFPPPELSGNLARDIVLQHLHSPAMWAIFPLQDLLAMDESLRLPDADAERINVPAIMPYYWRYRMHLGMEELSSAEAFNQSLSALLRSSGR
ncbi:MAG: 4-alpha-glucanotransferase [Akkermansiaceae bacterium]|jgi:4-alpha-glucanotransferase|nr:4-alpha-glucanotransferase [Akkermansiaceae bacterium]